MPALGGVRARLTAVASWRWSSSTAIVLGVGRVAVRRRCGCTPRPSRPPPTRRGFDLSVIVPGAAAARPSRRRGHRPQRASPTRSGSAGVETVVDLGAGEPPFLSDERLDGPARPPARGHARSRRARASSPTPGSDVAGRAVARRRRPAGRRAGRRSTSSTTSAALQDAVDQLRLALASGRSLLLVLALATRRAWSSRRPRSGRGGRPDRRTDRARRPVGAGARHVAGRVRDVGRAVQPDGRRARRHDPPARGGPAPEPPVRGRRVARAADAAGGARRRGVDRGRAPRRAAAGEPASGRAARRRRRAGCASSSRSSWSCRASTPRREEVALEPVDLVRLVRAVIAARQPTARFEPPAPSVVVETDPRRLDRILGNFLDNAREHAGGSDVTVDLDRRRARTSSSPSSDRGPGRARGSAGAHLRAVHEARPVAQRRQQRARPGHRRRARGAARRLPAGDEPRGRRAAAGARAARGL